MEYLVSECCGATAWLGEMKVRDVETVKNGQNSYQKNERYR